MPLGLALFLGVLPLLPATCFIIFKANTSPFMFCAFLTCALPPCAACSLDSASRVMNRCFADASSPGATRNAASKKSRSIISMSCSNCMRFNCLRMYCMRELGKKFCTVSGDRGALLVTGGRRWCHPFPKMDESSAVHLGRGDTTSVPLSPAPIPSASLLGVGRGTMCQSFSIHT